MEECDTGAVLCLGYFSILRRCRYSYEGIEVPGFSLTTDRRVPSCRAIFNDGDTAAAATALRDSLGIGHARCQRLIDVLLACLQTGDITAFPSFRSFDAAASIGREFLGESEQDIYSAVVRKTDVESAAVGGLYDDLQRVTLAPGGRFVGYEIIDAEFFCDTFRRPDLAAALHARGVELNEAGLLSNVSDANAVSGMMNMNLLPCEPNLKWTPFAVYRWS